MNSTASRAGLRNADGVALAFILPPWPSPPERSRGPRVAPISSMISEVVDPGTCQLETWVTGYSVEVGGGYANATNTCTLSSLPRLEFGLQFQHVWFGGTGNSEQLLGPALKVNLIPEERGVGLGLAFNGGVNMSTGAFELGTLVVPVSIPLNDKARINLNAGWQYLSFANSDERPLLRRPDRNQDRLGGSQPDAGTVRPCSPATPARRSACAGGRTTPRSSSISWPAASSTM